MERFSLRAGITLALLLVVAGALVPTVSYADTPAAPASGTTDPVKPPSVVDTVVGGIQGALNGAGTGAATSPGLPVVGAFTGAIQGATAGTNAAANGESGAVAGAVAGIGATGKAAGAVAHAGGAILTGIAMDIIAGIATFILWFASLLVGIAGSMFNWAVYVTVFQFGNLIGNSAGMLAAWGVLRDVGNIALLFGFIFMGVGTILNLHDYNAKKALPALIIFAILLNFSLLAAEAVIDTSNVFASLMYNQTGVCEAGTTATECARNAGIAGKIIENAGISTVFNITALKDTIADPFRLALVFTGLAIFVTVVAIILFAGAILLITRAVTLAFLIVLAPIGFAGMAIPPLQKLAKDWWHRLISNAFFAPVYLLMVLVSLKLMEGVKGALSVGGAADNKNLASVFLTGEASNISIVITFALLIGFMIGALLVAKKMGIMGADFAINTATGVATFPAALTGRTIVGGGSAALGKLQARASARVRSTFNNTVGTSLKDVKASRPATLGGKVAKGFKLAGLGAVSGAGNAIGRGTDDVLSDTIGKGKTAKFGSIGSYADIQKKHKERDHELGVAEKQAQLNDAMKQAESSDPVVAAAGAAEVGRLTQEMSAHEMAQTNFAKELKAGFEQIAKAMSPEKFADLMKDKDMDEHAKEKWREARYEDWETHISTGDKTEIRKWHQKDLEEYAKSNAAGFKALIEGRDPSGERLVSDDQEESLGKSGHLAADQRDLVKNNSKRGEIENLLDDGGGRRVVTAADIAAAVRIMETMGTKKVAQLKASILVRPEFAAAYKPAHLQSILAEQKLNTAQLNNLNPILEARRVSGRPDDEGIRKYLDPLTNAAAAAYYAP